MKPDNQTPVTPNSAPAKPRYEKPEVRTEPATDREALGASGPCGVGVDEESSCKFAAS